MELRDYPIAPIQSGRLMPQHLRPAASPRPLTLSSRRGLVSAPGSLSSQTSHWAPPAHAHPLLPEGPWAPQPMPVPSYLWSPGRSQPMPIPSSLWTPGHPWPTPTPPPCGPLDAPSPHSSPRFPWCPDVLQARACQCPILGSSWPVCPQAQDADLATWAPGVPTSQRKLPQGSGPSGPPSVSPHTAFSPRSVPHRKPGTRTAAGRAMCPNSPTGPTLPPELAQPAGPGLDPRERSNTPQPALQGGPGKRWVMSPHPRGAVAEAQHPPRARRGRGRLQTPRPSPPDLRRTGRL